MSRCRISAAVTAPLFNHFVQAAAGGIAVDKKLTCYDAEVGRPKQPRHDADEEFVVHILEHAVDSICQFVLLVEFSERAEVASVAAAGEGMLDIAGDCRIYMAARRFVIPEL